MAMSGTETLLAAPAERSIAHVRLLADAARMVHASLELHEKLEWVVRATAEVTEASFAAYVAEGDEARMEALSGRLTNDADLLVDMTARRLFGVVIDPEAGIGEATTIRVPDVAQERDWQGSTADPMRVRSWMAVPVVAGSGFAHGAIVVGHSDPNWFDIDDEEAVRALAAHLGVALDNLATVTKLAELEAVQREAVHQLQEAVRPPMPVGQASELGVHYLPADPSSPTGGDLYDWQLLPDGDLHLAVVDVMGKGVGATKDALSVTHALRLLVLEGCPMADLVARADALVTAQSPDVVATLVVARYRPADGRVRMIGAGHPPALLISPDGASRYLSVPGVPIGWPGAGSSEIVEVVLDRSETLVLYTDGLIEATKDVLVGLDGLASAAAEVARYPAGPLARALVDRALAGAQRRDDSVALVLRRRTPPPPTTTHPLGPFEYRFSPMSASVPLVRHVLQDWLDHLPIEKPEAADLVLMASELCANAVHHASGSPGGSVLRAWADGHDVVLEVEDDGEGFDWPVARDRDEVPDPEAERGRGLFLVETLSDDVSVTRHDSRNLVQVRRRAILSTLA